MRVKVLVEIVAGFIASLKVAVTAVLVATPVAFGVGDVAVTVGGVLVPPEVKTTSTQ